MKPIAAVLLCTCIAATAPALGQTAAPAPATGPWRARPLIIVDPRAYLSPSPRPTIQPAKRHATPRPRPHTIRTPETFERHETGPRPAATPRSES